MRIATSTLYESGLNALQNQQSQLLRTQQQVASGKRILTAADDPIGAGQALNVSEADASNTQYATNRTTARNDLGAVDTALASVTTLVQDVQTLAVSAGSGSMDDQQRGYLATELQGKLADLVGLANSSDGAGQYLFAGYQSSTAPYSQVTGGAQYVGDEGLRTLQVSPSRTLNVSQPGSAIFDRIKTGNGVFSAQAGATNTGTAVLGTGAVVSPAALTGHNYQLTFTVSGSTTTYSVQDQTAGTTAATGTYTSGNAIAFDGLQLDVSGAPANGDTVAVTPSANQSLFTTISNLIGALQTGTAAPGAKTALTNALGSAQQNLSQGLDNVLKVRAQVGSNLQELDTLDSIGQDLHTQYQTKLSGLQDVDYNQAITDLTRQQVALQAAQKSFASIQQLSLFTYLQ